MKTELRDQLKPVAEAFLFFWGGSRRIAGKLRIVEQNPAGYMGDL